MAMIHINRASCSSYNLCLVYQSPSLGWYASYVRGGVCNLQKVNLSWSQNKNTNWKNSANALWLYAANQTTQSMQKRKLFGWSKRRASSTSFFTCLRSSCLRTCLLLLTIIIPTLFCSSRSFFAIVDHMTTA